MTGHGSDPPLITPHFVSRVGEAPLHPGPRLREIGGEGSVAGKQLEPFGHDREVQEARIDERADELVVLLAPGGELGSGEVVAFEAPAAPVAASLGGEADEALLPARRHDRGPEIDPVCVVTEGRVEL